VLIEESLTPVTFKTDKGCRVVSGSWFGAYSGDVFTDASKLDIDNLEDSPGMRQDVETTLMI
jgi:hypothetical protein